MTTLTTSKGDTFETPYTNEEAMTKLRNNTSNFAQSLIKQYDRRRSLSVNQWPWVHKLVIDAETPRQPRQTVNLTNLVTLIEGAKRHLKYPKITVSHEGLEYRLSLAGDRAKYPGSVNITDLGSWGERTWYGRVTVEGEFHQSRKCSAELVNSLIRCNADPVAFAVEHGKATGCCCFCNKDLTDERSTAVGYGPVCAKHFELPWGKEKAVA